MIAQMELSFVRPFDKHRLIMKLIFNRLQSAEPGVGSDLVDEKYTAKMKGSNALLNWLLRPTSQSLSWA
jgi:hypothetical protein